MTDFKHGASGYRRHKCRCDVCRAGHAAEQAAARRKRRPSRAGRSAEAGPPVRGPVVPPAGVVPSAGPLEAKTAAEIEELAGLSPWTRECARLEEQALTAARIVDKCMVDGRLHLTTPQHKVIRDALADLKLILAPVRAPGRTDGRTALEIEADEFVASLTKFDRP